MLASEEEEPAESSVQSDQTGFPGEAAQNNQGGPGGFAPTEQGGFPAVTFQDTGSTGRQGGGMILSAYIPPPGETQRALRCR